MHSLQFNQSSVWTVEVFQSEWKVFRKNRQRKINFNPSVEDTVEMTDSGNKKISFNKKRLPSYASNAVAKRYWQTSCPKLRKSEHETKLKDSF